MIHINVSRVFWWKVIFILSTCCCTIGCSNEHDRIRRASDPAGYKYYPSVKKQFKLYDQEGATHEEAETKCIQDGGNLAVTYGPNYPQILKEFASNNKQRCLHISGERLHPMASYFQMSDDGLVIDADDREEGPSQQHWTEGEPDKTLNPDAADGGRSRNAKYCIGSVSQAEVQKKYNGQKDRMGQWNIIPCNDPCGFLCQLDSSNSPDMRRPPASMGDSTTMKTTNMEVPPDATQAPPAPDCPRNVDGLGEDGFNPLQRAANHGDIQDVGFLVEKCGADVNAFTRQGGNALHEAAYQGYPEIVRFLIEKGSDPNQPKKTADGWAPVHLAASGRNPLPVLEVLKEKGARISAMTAGQPKENALHTAAYAGKADLVSFLIDAGIDPNEPKNDGWAPVHLAIIGRDPIPVLKVLVQKRANMRKRIGGDGPSYWKTPLQLAEEKFGKGSGNDVIQFLEKYRN